MRIFCNECDCKTIRDLKYDLGNVEKERDLCRDNANKELEFLREAIKPYVKYQIDHHISLYTFPYYTEYFITDDTLEAALSRISDLKLYISVLETNLGDEATHGAQNEFNALKELKCPKA